MKNKIFSLFLFLFLFLNINKSFSDSKEIFNFNFTKTDLIYATGNDIYGSLSTPVSDSLLTSLVFLEFTGNGELSRSLIKEGNIKLGELLIHAYKYHVLELPPDTKNLSILFEISSNTSENFLTLEIIKSNIELYNETSLILWRKGGGKVPSQESVSSNLTFYDNFLDLFNNCEIDETKEKEISEPSDPYNPIKFAYCNFLFTKKNYKLDGKPIIILNNYPYWPDNNTELTKQNKIFFKSFREDIFGDYDRDYRKFSLINFKMLIISNPDNNKIGLMKLNLNHLAKIHLTVKDTSSDLCFDAISKFIIPFSNKLDLEKNKWKESSEKYRHNEKYPNGNSVFSYKKQYIYPLPDNKKIIVGCVYTPNLKDKNFYWNTEIYFTDSKLYKSIVEKFTIKSPKLNLKIIWKEITKEFFS